MTLTKCDSAFATVSPSNAYPVRRVSNDESTNLVPSRAPTANSTAYNFPRLTGVGGGGSGVPTAPSAGPTTARKRARLE